MWNTFTWNYSYQPFNKLIHNTTEYLVKSLFKDEIKFPEPIQELKSNNKATGTELDKNDSFFEQDFCEVQKQLAPSIKIRNIYDGRIFSNEDGNYDDNNWFEVKTKKNLFHDKIAISRSVVERSIGVIKQNKFVSTPIKPTPKTGFVSNMIKLAEIVANKKIKYQNEKNK